MCVLLTEAGEDGTNSGIGPDLMNPSVVPAVGLAESCGLPEPQFPTHKMERIMATLMPCEESEIESQRAPCTVSGSDKCLPLGPLRCLCTQGLRDLHCSPLQGVSSSAREHLAPSLSCRWPGARSPAFHLYSTPQTA